jgi:uroporphyrinogen decarboxylase
VDRPATGPLAVHYCAQMIGVSIRQYTTCSKTLADSVVKYWEAFRPDALWLSADTWVTAEAMGATVAFTDDNQPAAGAKEPLVRSAADVDSIPPPAPSARGRQPLMLEALARIRDEVGEQVFVVACFDQYPFSLACALMGIDRLMLKTIDDPTLIEALMRRCVDYSSAYGKALADAGADMLSGGDSPAGLIGPARYAELAAPYQRQVIERLKSHADTPVSLHICGNATPLLAEMAATGADVLELDHQVDMTTAAKVVGPSVAIWGNLDPVALLAQASPEQVRQATGDLISAFESAEHARYVVSSGCTLAMETPRANIHAMLEAARNHTNG